MIVDSEHLHDVALRAVCEPLGFSWSGDAWVGWPDAEVFAELYRRRGEPLSDAALASLLEVKTKVVLDQVQRDLYEPYPGVLELIRAASKEMPVLVCSAGLRGQIEPVLEKFGVRGCVRGIVAYEDTPRSKPDPAPYLLGAQRAGAEPRDCVAIEDSVRGVTSARAAGCVVVAVAHTTEAPKLAAAHRVVDTIGQLSVAQLRDLVQGVKGGRG